MNNFSNYPKDKNGTPYCVSCGEDVEQVNEYQDDPAVRDYCQDCEFWLYRPRDEEYFRPER